MAIQLWAGVECTVNRVGDRYFDQLVRNGHERRADDIDRFASLGIAAMRVPVLWERTAPRGLSSASWEWADRCLDRLAKFGIRPIVGLLHHGSGPPDTNLLDNDFPSKLAAFAEAVARRYPWVEAYTPVNEPLTTARFSGLYGHWYPHRQDDRSFLRALLNQCRATALAMQAIRSLTGSAQLVQTEDAGLTYSTPMLAYQARFDNARRVLGFDLLTGRMSPGHPLLDYLTEHGVTDEELGWFTAYPCAPDVIGLNYYLTSDRLLDERLECYPSWSHGGNRRHAYADIPAVRVWRDGITGFEKLLTYFWDRYRISVALTEAHLGCTREEQLRWLKEAWNGAHIAASSGADVKALTAWSLLGTYDWNKLVTEETGFYEPGVFDVRGPAPRRTALAHMMKNLSSHGGFEHPLLHDAGWWRQPSRFHFPPVGLDDEQNDRPADMVASDDGTSAAGRNHPLVIIGANGTLGHAFERLCAERGIPARALTRAQLDITDARAVDRVLGEIRPWAVVNAAGYVRVDQAEGDTVRCLRDNAGGARHLAETCSRYGIKLLTFSTDLVFDGLRTSPYLESHSVAPLNAYGRSKAEAERVVSRTMPSALIVRTSAFFGPWDSANFVAYVLRSLGQRRNVRTADLVVSPTYVPDLVQASLDLLIDDEQGLWHISNRGAVSWCEFARTAAGMASLDPSLIEPCEPSALGWSALRPSYSALGSERGWLLPCWEESLERYVYDRRTTSPAGSLC
jgi:dTDP-4-dehydrorhamnose reductase